MKIKKYSTAGALLVLLIFSVFSSTNEKDLIENNIVRVETINSEHVVFHMVKVTYANNKLTIKGFVNLKRSVVSGHFNATVISPDNVIIKNKKTEDLYYRRKKKRKSKFFSVELSLLPPVGSLIRLTFFENDILKSN